MHRFLTILLRFSITLVVLLGLLYFIVLHTNMGARWVINYFTNDSAISIKSIEGTLANEIKLTDVVYDDTKSIVKTKQVNYEINDIQWFSKKIIFDVISVQKIELELAGATNEEKTNTAFEGIVLPIEIDIQSLTVDKIFYHSEQKTEELNNIKLAVNFKNQVIDISNLSMGHESFLVEGNGFLQLKTHLPFELFTNWNVFDKHNYISGKGKINGDLSQVYVKQNVDLQKGIASGEFYVEASIDNNTDTPKLNVNLTANKILIKQVDQPEIAVENIRTQLLGNLDNYKLTSEFVIFSDALKRNAINLSGKGGLESIDLDKLRLINSQSTVNLPIKINWSEGISAFSKIELINLNPEIYVQQWPGLINGNANLTVQFSNDTYAFSIEDVFLNGTLKQQEFSLKGSSFINSKNNIISRAHFILGKNEADIFATINDNNIEAEINAVLNDLSKLDENSSGTITANFNVNGDIHNPEIMGQAHASNIKYEDYLASSIDIKAKGSWLSNMTAQINAEKVIVKNKLLKTVNIDFNGNKDNHNFTLAIKDDQLDSALVAKGQYSDINRSWDGQILKHDVVLEEINSTWQLKDPVDIVYKKDIEVSKACWVNQKSSGDICINLSINTDLNNHQINAALNNLNVRFLRIFLPNNLIVNGKLDGNADINIFDDNVQVNSKFNLLEGEIQYYKDSLQTYQAKVLTASFHANQDEKNSIVQSKILLDDGTTLDFNLDIFKSKNEKIEIKGDIKGLFTNTQYLASLTEEIEDISGDFNLNGTVEGPLSDLIINIDAKQNQGQLTLAQTKTKISNINLQVIQQPSQNLEFKLVGEAGKGQFNSTGELIIDPKNANVPWQINALLKGDNIRLLTLPELELDITPDIIINMSNKSTKISGDIKVPYAWLNIKQLPESAISASPDVIIHDDAYNTEDSDQYPIIFDVNALIEKPIDINVLGLKSGLQGNLKVNNKDNSRINANGTLKLIDGKYSIYGQSLDISKGELLFNGAIDNPSLDVIASRKSISGEVTAGVELGGTVNYLQSSLYSDPQLSDLEILSYILSGRGLNEESDTSSQQLVQAAIILGLKKSSPIFSEIQSKLGIDVLTIKEGSTTKDSIVEAGKQFNEKLYVGYNQGLFNRVGFWVLRYRINKALRLETTQGDTQSVDLIYVRKKK